MTNEDLARELILFIRQNPFLPENDNLQHVTKLIEKAEVRGKVEQIRKCKIAILKSWELNYCEKELAQLTDKLEGLNKGE